MASTLTQILLHITFSTKNREPTIQPSIEPDLYAYIGGICRAMESPLLAMGGVADHVHLLVSLDKKISTSDLLLNVKRDSSKWMKQHVQGFRWQDGYFAFSIGASGITAVRRYIADQKPHHATIGFQDELRKFFRRYGIEWDERYVWE
jgi:REP element-mobilizing transposase RayT